MSGERVFPSNQFEGVTDDEISSQVTDDSLHGSVNLNTLDLTADTHDSSGMWVNIIIGYKANISLGLLLEIAISMYHRLLIANPISIHNLEF